jgi:probable phosphoglycerate mutase
MVREWQSGNHDYRIPGGESATELKNRIDSFIDDLRQREESTILISSHGRAIRMLIARLLGESVSDMEKYGHDNTGLYLLEYNGNGYELVLANDTSHLK